MLTVWDERLRPQDRAALDPGVPAEFHTRPDVLVVGGGIVGLATAVMCRRAGLGRVALVERDRLACGPSGSAAGGLSPDTHALTRPRAFLDLARTGLEVHRQLNAEWHYGLRSLDWVIPLAFEPSDELAERAAATRLDTASARAIEPELGECEGALVIRNQAHVDPLRTAAAFAREAGCVATGVSMLSVEPGPRVRTDRFGDISAGAVVICTGAPGQDPLRAWSSTKGHLLSTAPAPFELRTGVGSTILVLQLDDGRLLAGGTFDVGDDSPDVRRDVVAAIRDEMARLVPRSAHVDTERAWCCFRPGLSDELPAIDLVDEHVWVNVGHHRTGLLVAPAAGRAIAEWIATETRPPELEPFTLERATAP
jgi:glycine oxidase